MKMIFQINIKISKITLEFIIQYMYNENPEIIKIKVQLKF